MLRKSGTGIVRAIASRNYAKNVNDNLIPTFPSQLPSQLEVRRATDAVPPKIPPTPASSTSATVLKNAAPFGEKPIITPIVPPPSASSARGELPDMITSTKTSMPMPSGEAVVPPNGPAEPPLSSALLPPQAPKKRHRIRNTFLATVLGGALLFGGGLYASMENDTVYELFTEYVPYGEDAVLYLQEREFNRRYPNARKYVNKQTTTNSSATSIIPSSGGVRATIVDVPIADLLKTGPQNSAIAPEHRATTATAAGQTNKISAKQVVATQNAQPLEAKERVAQSPAKEIAEVTTSTRKQTAEVPETQIQMQTPTQNQMRPPTAEAPVAEKDVSSKPVSAQASGGASAAERTAQKIDTFSIPSVNNQVTHRLATTFNDVILQANAVGCSDSLRSAIEAAKDEIDKVNARVADIQASEQTRAEERLNEQAKQFSNVNEAQAKAINAQLRDYEAQVTIELEQERQKMNEAYQQRLHLEIEKVEALAEQKLKNELVEQAIEMQRRFIREIKGRVEEERGGRLGKLEILQKSIAELKQIEVDSSAFIGDRVKAEDLTVALHALRNVLNEERSRPFVSELAAVKELAAGDDLIRASIATIDRDSYESGVPTIGQLAERFRKVADEVRKAALLPEGAGVAGHAGSYLLSKIMFRKQGMVGGADAESILARTEAFLESNNLDLATREMNQLKGWAKLLSSDWLRMARRQLELQQAIELVETQALLQSLHTA